MAKFKSSDLLLQEEQRILFGDDASLTNPVQYPVTTVGSEKPFMAYTTISGYNTTVPGGGTTPVVEIDELVVSVPLAGERATSDYHLVRYDQLLNAVNAIESGDWQNSVISITNVIPGSPSDGDRYLVDATASGSWTGLEDYIVEWNTASGIWDQFMPNEGFTTFVDDEDKYYLYYNNSWAPMGEGIDHGDLIGLGDDDHIQYVPTDASRGFTATVSGIYPTLDYHLTTKDYVDDQIATISGVVAGDYVTLTTTQTITGDKTFNNTLTTFLGGVFFDAMTITMSGTTLNTEASPTFNYDSTSTLNYEGDSVYQSGSTITHESGSSETYESGSTVTFSGTTTFETQTTFNDTMNTSDILFGANTISGTGPIYGDIQDSKRKYGREVVILGATSQAVTFNNPYVDDNYTLVATLTNEVDSPPSIYSTIQGIKTGGGFTTHFSGRIDSANFVLEWIAIYGQNS